MILFSYTYIYATICTIGFGCAGATAEPGKIYTNTNERKKKYQTYLDSRLRMVAQWYRQQLLCINALWRRISEQQLAHQNQLSELAHQSFGYNL